MAAVLHLVCVQLQLVGSAVGAGAPEFHDFEGGQNLLSYVRHLCRVITFRAEQCLHGGHQDSAPLMGADDTLPVAASESLTGGPASAAPLHGMLLREKTIPSGVVDAEAGSAPPARVVRQKRVLTPHIVDQSKRKLAQLHINDLMDKCRDDPVVFSIPWLASLCLDDRAGRVVSITGYGTWIHGPDQHWVRGEYPYCGELTISPGNAYVVAVQPEGALDWTRQGEGSQPDPATIRLVVAVGISSNKDMVHVVYLYTRADKHLLTGPAGHRLVDDGDGNKVWKIRGAGSLKRATEDQVFSAPAGCDRDGRVVVLVGRAICGLPLC